MKGNEAIAEAAILAGCRHYFGYPITPQTEVAAYMAKKMPKIGGVFLQAESEIAAINMVYGVASTGKRAMIILSPTGSYYAANNAGLTTTRIYVEDQYIRAAQGGTGYAKVGGNYGGGMPSILAVVFALLLNAVSKKPAWVRKPLAALGGVSIAAFMFRARRLLRLEKTGTAREDEA